VPRSARHLILKNIVQGLTVKKKTGKETRHTNKSDSKIPERQHFIVGGSMIFLTFKMNVMTPLRPKVRNRSVFFQRLKKPSKLFWSTGALSCSFSESEFNRCYELARNGSHLQEALLKTFFSEDYAIKAFHITSPISTSPSKRVIRVGITTLGQVDLNRMIGYQCEDSFPNRSRFSSLHLSLLALLLSCSLNASSNGNPCPLRQCR
jgi:hypothetical protein